MNQWEYAAQIAVNHAIQDNILPDYAINLIVVNTNAQESVAVNGSLQVLSTVHPHAFIGGALSPETIALQYVLKGAQVPQIGPTASAEQLGRRDQNPFFMRPVASEYDEAKAILSLLQRYDWANIAMITTDDDVGSGGAAALDRALAGSGVTIMSRMVLAIGSTDDLVKVQLQAIIKTNAKIMVCISGLTGLPQILRIGTDLGMFTANYGWVMGGQARLVDSFTDTLSSLMVPGILLIGRYEGEGAGYERLRNDMVALPRATYPYSAAVVGMTTGIGYVYDSCATIIRAAAEQRNQGMPLSNGTALYKNMNKVHFDGATGAVAYENGERVYSSVVVMFRDANKKWAQFGVVQRVNRSLESYTIATSQSPIFIGGSQSPPQDLLCACFCFSLYGPTL